MIILYILGGIYLTIGFIYALYILLFSYDEWYAFPINWLFGPLTLVYVTLMAFKGKKASHM